MITTSAWLKDENGFLESKRRKIHWLHREKRQIHSKRRKNIKKERRRMKGISNEKILPVCFDQTIRSQGLLAFCISLLAHHPQFEHWYYTDHTTTAFINMPHGVSVCFHFSIRRSLRAARTRGLPCGEWM